MPPEKQKMFQHVLNASKEIAQVKDVDLLLEKILHIARRLSSADAGSIYIREDEHLRFHHTQNGHPQDNGLHNKKKMYTTSSVPVSHNSVSAYVARKGKILNISDISQLPQNIPFSFDQAHDGIEHYHIKSLIAFPLTNSDENVVGVIQLINMKDENGQLVELSDDALPLVQLFGKNAANAIERAQTTRARVQGIIQILTALRDTEETVAHVNRVGAYASEIYETWAHSKKLPEHEITAGKDILRLAAMLHDVGKLAIPNVIRRKPGKLTDEEYEVMKQHTVKGAQLLAQHANSDVEKAAAEIALTHHEHWDGTGYPGYIDLQTGRPFSGYETADGHARGKKGGEIPVFGRVVAIADVYDSLSNPRVFRNAWQEDDILKMLKEGAGTQFDPDMIDAFFASLDTLHAIAGKFQE